MVAWRKDSSKGTAAGTFPKDAKLDYVTIYLPVNCLPCSAVVSVALRTLGALRKCCCSDEITEARTAVEIRVRQAECSGAGSDLQTLLTGTTWQEEQHGVF